MANIIMFSNIPLLEEDITSTGTWIKPVVDELELNIDFDIFLFSWSSSNEMIEKKYKNIKQWLVPIKYQDKNGYCNDKLIKRISNILQKINPSLYHVWGLESAWGGVVTSELVPDAPFLLEIQGLKSACGDVYTADLSVLDVVKCISIKEIIKNRNFFKTKKEYLSWEKYESRTLKKADLIHAPSNWVSSRACFIGGIDNIKTIGLNLRPSFYSSSKWLECENLREKDMSKNIFFLSSGPIPYKGTHVAVKALSILVKKDKSIRLRIGGNFSRYGVKADGYTKWLLKMAKDLGVYNNIDWLGALTEHQIIQELQLANVNLVCSFVESYCLALAEGMFLGVPSVTSFNGGTSSIATSDTVSFYSPGDFVACAIKLSDLIYSKEKSKLMSKLAVQHTNERHSQKKIASNYIASYEKLLNVKL